MRYPFGVHPWLQGKLQRMPDLRALMHGNWDEWVHL